MKQYPATVLPLTRKIKTGMVPEQFYLLQKGDIIKGNKPNGAYRKIQDVHVGKNGETYGIRLLKIARSRYPSPYTTYGPGDSSAFVPIKVKDKRIWDITYESAMKERRKILKVNYRRRIKEAQRRIEKMYEALG